MTPNIADIIRHHVSLEVRCIDRLYVNGYMPKLQTSGGLSYFLRDHLGYPIPSPALFSPIHDRFVTAVQQFATHQEIPVVEFESGQDKDAIVARARARFTRREGVVVVGIAQEKMRSFKAHKRRSRQEGRIRFLAPVGRRQPLLLLCPRSGLGTGVSEDRDVSALPGEALSEWPRMGETASTARSHSL
jgi:hypothetical protein